MPKGMNLMGPQMQPMPLQMMMGGGGGGNPGMGNLPLLNMGNGMQAFMLPMQGMGGDKNQQNMPSGMPMMMGMPQGLGSQGMPQGIMMQNPMFGMGEKT